MASKRQIVFISCGQVSDSERDLGRQVADLVTKITPFEGYFAQNQSSFEGVAEHILRAINRCVGFIAIIHHRGEVKVPNAQFNRASVWIEQEIAVAAFLQLIQRRQLKVVVYARSDIVLEGLREKLMLNPVAFDKDEEVVEHLRGILPSWKLSQMMGDSADEALKGKIRASLAYCERNGVTVEVKNDCEFEIVLKQIELRHEGGLITEPYQVPEAVSLIAPNRSIPFHWLANTPPAVTLAQWNSNDGLFFQADIEIVLACEVFGSLRRIGEKKKVKVSATNMQLKQLGP